jgi:esterase/lipase superfamily enzyme
LSIFGITYWDDPIDQRRHFTIRSTVILPEDDWARVVNAQDRDTALIFVHGYRTSFNEAAYRTAQIIWDIQYKGLAILFSWPSRGDFLDYVYDVNSATGARDHFLILLRQLTDKFHVKKINVIAHSMGNWMVLDALAANAGRQKPLRISELIMAAPDIDAGLFPSMARAVKAVASGMTMYASATDKALALSAVLAGGILRAGTVGPDGPLVVPNVDSIDATAVGDEMFGVNHDVFAATRSLIGDISALIRTGRRPPSDRTAEIHAVPEGAKRPRYWRFVP